MTATAEAVIAAEDARPVVRLLAGRQRRVRAGHPWVYSNEIDMTAEAKALAPGTLVALADAGGAALGAAMFNPRSLIAARIIARDPRAVIDRAFLAGVIGRAVALRERLYDAPFYRAVHSEADGLPGLIVDRYGAVAVVQANAAGTARLLDDVTAALIETTGVEAVLLRNTGPALALEGLAEETRWLAGVAEGPQTVIENGVRFAADLAGGQKTGWYYDHRENRALIARLAAGARVLDLYSYLGGFGVQAAVAGAAEVVMVDRSEAALALAAQAADENGVTARCTFRRAEAFAEMARLAEAGERFDIVVCDPPAFVRTKRELGAGARGYRKMTRLAAALAAPGRLLFCASCSHHVDAALFAEQVRGGLGAAGRGGRILFAGGAGPDHPVHPHLPESAYLKYQLLQLD